MANIKQLKAQVPHLGCEKKFINLEVLILYLQGEDLDKSLKMMKIYLGLMFIKLMLRQNPLFRLTY